MIFQDPQFDLPSDGLVHALVQLVADLPETLFWVKNRRLELVAINQTFARRVKLPPEQVLGRTDAELYFSELARVFAADDLRVLETGEAIRGKYELLASPLGGLEWRLTSKFPVWHPASGEIIATTGISLPLDPFHRPLPSPYQTLGRLIETARHRLSEGLQVPQLASLAGMSIATLNRRFRQHFHISAGHFLQRLRLSKATQLLQVSPLNVSEVAIECGYESPAAFTRAFKRETGVSPSAYRKTRLKPASSSP
ncbi:MAG: helix-turn-helix domain-containing protein [Puniceicoccaceae bacterium]